MFGILIAVFVIGYLFIAFEHTLKINKAAFALITGVLCWTILILSSDYHVVNEHLTAHLGELSGILFFLLGAMTIVELIDSHNGFDIITSFINQTSKRKLLWIICFITFFLSAVLDNLTTTIVMVSLLRKLIDDKNDRMLFIGMTVIAANAGGAWSPIGDVTTTMLWIGGQITATNIIIKLILPSLVCLIVPLIFLTIRIKGKVQRPQVNATANKKISVANRNLIFFSGLFILMLVPVFKSITHLPPYMGILIGLGVLWILTELIHSSKSDDEKKYLSVTHALKKIDTSSILFFLGILVSISALQTAGILTELAAWLQTTVNNDTGIALFLGVLSSVVDNVPLVAASQGMYPLTAYPTDHYFWELLAYTTGTGGSALIIGSAAGVAAMGIEKISFFWYIKKISWLALIGFFAGAIVYIIQ
jgi:Na+/H+ antiporter NhaD/arsenite permease-like protein